MRSSKALRKAASVDTEIVAILPAIEMEGRTMPMNTTMRAALIAATLGFAGATAIPAGAQETMEAPAAQAPAPAANYDEAKLQSFVVAFLQVDQINRTYAPQLQEADGEEAQNTVREQASEEMVQAVESVDGITVEEYGTIIQQAQTDPALAEQINTYIQAAVGQPAEPAAPAEPAPAQ
jgi:hypothetical protein